MKKLVSILFIFAALLLLSLSAGAETLGGICGSYGSDNVKWEFNTETGLLRIYGSGDMADYYQNNLTPWYGFKDSLTAIEIDEGVTSVGENAFFDMHDVTSVSFPSSMRDIRRYSFINSGIKEISISDGVTHIRDYAFYGCRNLKTATLPNSLTEIGDYAFYNSTLENVNIPAGVTTIGTFAFSNTNLTEVTIPEGAAVSSNAFYECRNLTRFTLPQSMTVIPKGLFCGTAIKELVIPNWVTEIGEEAFAHCKELESVTMAQGQSTIGSDDSTALTEEISLPSSLTEIGGLAFRDCTSLESIVIPESVTILGGAVFQGCTGLKSVDLPENITWIGQNLFSDCSSLESIKLPENTATIEGAAFSGCDSLTEIYLPKNVSQVSFSAFADCLNLEAITVAEDNQSLYDDGGVLYSKTDSTLICYPAARPGEEYSIVAGTTTIGTLSFESCHELKRLIIPAEVSSLSGSSFRYASSIEDFIVAEDNQTYMSRDGVIFSKDGRELICYPSISRQSTYVVPEGVEEIGGTSFANCSNLNGIILPDSLKVIGANAFFSVNRYTGCTELVRVSFSETANTGIWNDAFGFSLKTVILPDNIVLYSKGAFQSHYTVVLCRAGTQTEAMLRDFGGYDNYIPSIIAAGETSSIVGAAVADREAVVNSVTVPVYRVNNSLYVSERDLANCGYTFTWDGAARTTTITPPENPSWTVTENIIVNPVSVDIWSSDIEFKLDGFTIPSLNIGNGESVLDINALAGYAVY